MITAFLPCRKGSQRIPDKNIKNFAGVQGGLLKIKLDQLLQCSSIDQIILSSNDDRVLEFASRLNEERIIIDERPDYLGSNKTTTDELIAYVPELIKEGEVLWTHVTSPFINAGDYHQIISSYLDQKNNGYDSLMTVQKIQGFIWNKDGALSYDRSKLKWPMTQNIEPLYEIDSGIFLSNIDSYIKNKDRIGSNPFLFVQDKSKSIDIDWPEDFRFAESLWKRKD